METLLSLTSKRAGEWFKEELRELGGLEHIVKTICECSKSLETYISQWTDPLLDKLRKIDRCLRVLENVTSQNEENQIYLLKYNDGILISTMIKLYKICNDEIALYPCTDPTDKVSTGYVIREALLATLKVLINLTQDFNKKSKLIVCVVVVVIVSDLDVCSFVLQCSVTILYLAGLVLLSPVYIYYYKSRITYQMKRSLI